MNTGITENSDVIAETYWEHNGQASINDAGSEIRRTLGAILQPGQVTELRALDVSTSDCRKAHIESGYFDDPELLSAAAERLINYAKGIYFIPNPVAPSLLARASNRVRSGFDREPCTSDTDILERLWLLVDADPVRPAGISSSDEEHELALARVREIAKALAEEGWPDPIVADSGNGAHLLYRIELPADDDGLVKRVLEALAFRFDDAQVTVDRKVYNPARIWKLYGTMSRKGDDRRDRPHRCAHMLEIPDALVPVPTKLLGQLAESVPAPGQDDKSRLRSSKGFSIEAWIDEHRLDICGPIPWNSGRKWVLRECPWNPDHRNRSAYIVQLEDGAIAAGCHHNSCSDKRWYDLRDAVEPGWREASDKARRASGKKTGNGKPAENTVTSVEILDDAPEAIRRPLCLVGGHSYAATWLWVRKTIHQTTDDDGTVEDHDPPIVRELPVLTVVRDDGCIFSDGEAPDTEPLPSIGLTVYLPEMPPVDRRWSGSGVKRFLAGQRPDPADVFRRIVEIVDRFMDFDRSLATQEVMCELAACYVLATYMLDGFNVIGFLWPNGDRGSGKTHFLFTVTEMAYLGQVVLAGGSHATLRDMADYGATLAFDDAEGIMDVKRADPDKRALLLSGNRRGATVTLKEPSGPKGWVTRYVHTYCPRLFSAIRLPDDVLASRTITIPLVRSADPTRSNADPLDYSLWPHDHARLRDDLYAMALVALPVMHKYDAEVAAKAKLSGRNLQPWRAILAVALWLQEEHHLSGLFERIEELSIAYQSERGDLERTDLTRLVIRALRNLIRESDRDTMTFQTAELVKRVNALAVTAEASNDDELFTNSKQLGCLLSRLRFTKADKKDARGWRTSRAEVEALQRAYEVPSEPSTDVADVANAETSPTFPTSATLMTFAEQEEDREVFTI